MALSIGFQMDHISTINIAGDSGFALMLEAKRRGHMLFHFTPDRLSLEDGKALTIAEPVDVRDKKSDHFSLGEAQSMAISEFDVVLMRQDPPFDMAYVASTHILQSACAHTLIVNDPDGVRNAPEKLLVTQLADLMPATLISRSRPEIERFRQEHGDIVIKPLFGHGGASVFRLNPKDANFESLFELFSQMNREPFICQKYLPEITQGDKRILLVDGEFAGAINRIPQSGQLRANMARGGDAEIAALDTGERDIVRRVGPLLRQRKITLAGIDVIGGRLTEINVTAPTGIRALAQLGGPDVAALVWDSIENRLSR